MDPEKKQEDEVKQEDEEFDYEAAAIEEGWNPKYDGPDKKTAKEFYERGREIRPILQANNKRLKEENEQLKSKVDSLEVEFRKSLKLVTKKLKEDTERKIADIREQKKKAVKDANEEEYERLEKEEDEVKKNVIEETQENNDEQFDYTKDPTVSKWIKDNPWYMDNPRMKNYADAHSQFLASEGLTGEAYLNGLTEAVKEKFPEHFNNQRRNNPSVATPSPSSEQKDKSFASLPKEARDAFETSRQELDNMGYEYTKEEYAKDYYENE